MKISAVCTKCGMHFFPEVRLERHSPYFGFKEIQVKDYDCPTCNNSEFVVLGTNQFSGIVK